MANDYTYPSNAALTEIAQDLLPQVGLDDPLFGFFPITEEDASILLWDQEDNWTGLQQIRGLGGPPLRVAKVGANRYRAEPGYYGEFSDVDEEEITTRRRYGTFGQPVDISDLVMKAQTRLLQRRLNRIKQILWLLLTTGSYSVAQQGGTMITGSYTFQTFSASVPWATPGTATPLGDFRTVQLNQRGHSVSFGSDALAFMNRITSNRMLANTNSADLYGRRVTGLATANNIQGVGQLFAQDDLPSPVVYENGYLPDGGGAWIPFIPDGKVVVIGKREGGQKLGDYAMTRNASNPNAAPGPYMFVRDSLDYGELPRRIDVHDGHNGGPRMLFPSGVTIMSV